MPPSMTAWLTIRVIVQMVMRVLQVVLDMMRDDEDKEK